MCAEYTLLFGRPKRSKEQASYCNRQRLYTKSAAKVQKKNDIHKRRTAEQPDSLYFYPIFPNSWSVFLSVWDCMTQICKPYRTKKFYLPKCLGGQEKSTIFVGEFWLLRHRLFCHSTFIIHIVSISIYCLISKQKTQ